MKTTLYFEALRSRPDRAIIREEWIEQAIRSPVKEVVQADGRTVHNAFFDRRFVP
jgi:hypothetical protein